VARYEETIELLRSKPERWLITGVAGFIGSHLLETLLRLDQTVVGLDNFSTGHRRNLNEVCERVEPEQWTRFSFIEGDVRDLVTCSRAMAGVSLVLHEAALGSVPRSMVDPAASHASNVDGFVNVLLAAQGAGVRRVVFASSSSVYGDEQTSPKLESKIGRPLSPYAATKLIDEIYADTFLRTHGIDSVALRYFNVFGARQDPNGAYAAVIPRWTERLLSGERCVLYGDGNKSRDFCYVANVVQANILAARATAAEVAPRVFNIACGERTTLLELFAALRERVTPFRPSAAEVLPFVEPERDGDIPHSLAAIDRAVACLGYVPTHDLRRGLDETVGYYARALGKLELEAERTLRPLEVAP
jgi:UDP-N-acetylglucosamine/UDP-N-acetylgalactosamine 4-epimerase